MRDVERSARLCTSRTPANPPRAYGEQRKRVTAIFWGSSGSPQRSAEMRRIDRDERKTLVQSSRHGIGTRCGYNLPGSELTLGNHSTSTESEKSVGSV